MTETAGRPTAASAQALAIQAQSEIDKHEAVCAERYAQIAKDIGSIKGLLRWVATTGVVAMLGMGTWGIEQWVTSSGADQKAQRQKAIDQDNQIAFLKTQVTSLTSRLQPGQQVVVAGASTRLDANAPTSQAPPAVDATPPL